MSKHGTFSRSIRMHMQNSSYALLLGNFGRNTPNNSALMPRRKPPNQINTQEVASVRRDYTIPLLWYTGTYTNPDDVLAGRGKGLYQSYEDLKKDGHAYSVLNKRALAVIAREWKVDAASNDKLDKKAADMVKYHLTHLAARADDEDVTASGFDGLCYNLLDAILKGFKPAEIIWSEDGKEVYPTQVKTRNQQRFKFGLNDRDKWELRLLTRENLFEGEALQKLYPRKFFAHTFGATDDNPYGVGIGRTIWWNVFFKKQGAKFWLQFVDKFAMPTAIGKYKTGATKEQKQTLLDALQSIATDAGVICPEGMEIALLEAARSGSTQTYEGLCGYMDSEISKAVLGETLSTEIGDRGSYAAAQTHDKVRMQLSKADADLLSDTLNRTLIKWICDINLPGAKAPQLWRDFGEQENLDSRVQRDKTLFDMGFKLKAASVKEIYGDDYEEVQQGGEEITPEQFLANSGAGAEPITNEGDGASVAQDEETADMAEVNFGAIIDRVLKWNGLQIGVEHGVGAVRFPKSRHAKKLRSGYGHIRGFVNNNTDGEALDCYIYPGLLKDEPEGSNKIYEVRQLSADGEFDEHKYFVGFSSLKAARDAYLQEMPQEFFGGIKEVMVADLEVYRRQTVNLSSSQSLPFGTNFAEQDKDGIDEYADQLKERAAPFITNWVEQIRSVVEGAKDFEEARRQLEKFYPKLNTTDFGELMAQALVVSEAAGRWEVLQETSSNENFAEGLISVNDSQSLLDLKAILEETYTDGITAIREVRLEGDNLIGIFEDKVSDKFTKRYDFTVNENEVSFKLQNPDSVENYVESVDFAAKKGAATPKNCPKGTPCGGSCISKLKTCRKSTSAGAKAKVAEVKKRAGGGAEVKKSSEAKKGNTGSQILPRGGTSAMAKFDPKKAKTTGATEVKKTGAAEVKKTTGTTEVKKSTKSATKEEFNYKINRASHTETIELGRKFSEKYIKLVELKLTVKELKLKEEKAENFKQLMVYVNKGEEPPARLTKQASAIDKKLFDETNKRELKQIQISEKKMESLRQAIIKKHGVDEKSAQAYVDRLVIGDNLARQPQALSETKQAIKEVFRMSGGRVAATLNYVNRENNNRAYANWGAGEIVLGKSSDRRTIFHEAGHHVEYQSQSVREAARDFIESRATSKIPEKLSKLTGNKDYDDHEVAMPGKFTSPYIGKINGAKGATTEVVSMGLENFHSKEKMKEYHDKDPQHFYFTIGVLIGED